MYFRESYCLSWSKRPTMKQGTYAERAAIRPSSHNAAPMPSICLLFLLSSSLPALAWPPSNISQLPTYAKIRTLDEINVDRDFRIALRASDYSKAYTEGLLLLRKGQVEDGLSRLEKAIEKALGDSSNDSLTFNAITHRYMGLATLLTGLQRPARFFRQLANEHPENAWAQATFASTTLRIEGIETMGKGLKLINKALQGNPTNLFVRTTKALALSYLPFGFAAAEREWQRILKDPTLSPGYTSVLMAFQRQMYLMHGHHDKAATIPQTLMASDLTPKITASLQENSLDDFKQFLDLQRQGRVAEALQAIEHVLERELESPVFSHLFGQYLIALGRDNERGARFFERLHANHPSSPHALAAYGFYTQIVDGAKQIQRGLDIIEEAQKQAGQENERHFAFSLNRAVQMASIPGQLNSAIRELSDLVTKYRSQLPYAPWVVRSHIDALREVHGLQHSEYWSTYDPWKDYVEENDEQRQGCIVYLNWNF